MFPKGTTIISPTEILLGDIPGFADTILGTVVENLFAIEYKLSPRLTV